MKQILAVWVLMVLLMTACEKKAVSPPERSETPSGPKVTVEREQGERPRPLPPEVKIKLKRDGNDNYSWELSSSDVDQILKVDGKLKKGLGAERPK